MARGLGARAWVRARAKAGGRAMYRALVRAPVGYRAKARFRTKAGGRAGYRAQTRAREIKG